LDFSKIKAGKLIFEILDFDWIETVESTLDLLAEAAHGSNRISLRNRPKRSRNVAWRFRTVAPNPYQPDWQRD
jgi:hypothetical protein